MPARHRPNRSPERGTSLAELMIALVVLSIGLLAVAQLFPAGSRGQVQDRMLTTASYYAQGADELLFMDAVASLYGRNSLLDVVERTAREIFVPLCVGGGLRSLDDIEQALRAGADKVGINSAAVNRPDFINEAARRFGSSTIVISIDANPNPKGGWQVYTDNGRENSYKDVVAWAQEAEGRGAGEILLTAIPQEGTGKGYDNALIRAVATQVQIPVIACGGAGRPEHAAQAVNEGRADAVCLASVLHYQVVARLQAEGFRFGNDGDFPVVAERREFARIEAGDIAAVKQAMRASGIACRLEPQAA